MNTKFKQFLLREGFMKEVSGQEWDATSLGQIAAETTDALFEHFGLQNEANEQLWSDINDEIQQTLYSIVHKHVKDAALPKFGEEF